MKKYIEFIYRVDDLVVLCEFDDSLNLLRELVPGVSVCFGSESFYYHYDRLGSVRFLTDASGNIIQEYNYDAFGNLLSSSGSLNQPYEYVGREGYYREEFGLYLLGVRWYDSSVGRFISRDPIGEKGGINLYEYSKNNPQNYFDPQGLKEEKNCWEIHQECITNVQNFLRDCVVNHCGYRGSLGPINMGCAIVCRICKSSGDLYFCTLCPGCGVLDIITLWCITLCLESSNIMGRSFF